MSITQLHRYLNRKNLDVKYLDIKISDGSLMNMDLIDAMNEQWRRVRPDLDPTPLEVVGRVIVLAQFLDKSVNQALAKHDLSLGQFDILATLRRHEGDGLTPKQLMQSVILSSGGMTNRLDRLERAGYIARQPDPTDRRGVVIRLTPAGRKLIDQATETRFNEATASLPPLKKAELAELSRLLQKWLACYGKEE